MQTQVTKIITNPSEERAYRMIAMYINLGKNLKQIGDAFGLTKERVRQILSQFEGYHEYHKDHAQNREHPTKTLIAHCENCGAEIVYREKGYKKRFCNSTCRKAHEKKKWEDMKEMTCSKCGTTKPIDRFYETSRGRVRKTGERFIWCKSCHNRITELWRKNNPERAKKISRDACKRYIVNHPDRQELLKKKYHSDTDFRKKVIEKNKKWYYLNQDEEKERARKYYQAHKEEINRKNKERRELKKHGN